MLPDFQIAIIGTGFSGIIAALRLQQSGRNSFIMLERAASIGGTWRDNTYPGCACDVPSLLYSISFVPKPDWSRGYGTQPEILAYMQDVVRSNRLEAKMRFDAEIILYEFLEEHGLWRLTDASGRIVTARQVIAGWGPFNRPTIPKISGLEHFQGLTLHSARWNQTIELSGKRVAVIGTGASAIQIVPSIVAQVAHLTVFQRNAAWLGDRMDAPVPAAVQERYKRYPWLQRLARGFLYQLLELRGQLFLGNKLVHGYMQKLSLQKLEREVQNLEIRRKLTPNYTLGCKRILSSDEYLPAFNRDNVSLETDAIAEITSGSICTVYGTEHAVDVIIFATGFEVAEITTTAKVIGLSGRELFSQWKTTGLEAYKGICVAGYPNFTLLLGPNTGLGHSSMLGMIEAQMNYIMQYTELLEKTKGYLDVRADIQNTYNQHIHQQFQGTVWASGCKSWYVDSRGKITTLYPRLVQHFRGQTKNLDPLEFSVTTIE